MNQAAALKDLTQVIGVAADEVTLASAAGHFAEAVGFRWFTYLSIGGPRPEAVSTYPAVWSDHYFANRFELVDPVVRASSHTGAPFVWGMDRRDRPEAPAVARVFDDAASFGIMSGLTVPLQGPGERFALFTLSTDEDSEALRRQADSLMRAAQLGGLQLHACLSKHVERFKPAPRPSTLTGQQRACLQAASLGMTAKEAARRVGLSPRTVQFHFDEARRRLGAGSLPHAVAMALRRGLIT